MDAIGMDTYLLVAGGPAAAGGAVTEKSVHSGRRALRRFVASGFCGSLEAAKPDLRARLLPRSPRDKCGYRASYFSLCPLEHSTLFS